jgi:hypothetical protein
MSLHRRCHTHRRGDGLGFSVARKYNIGDVPKAFLNIEMNALGVL